MRDHHKLRAFQLADDLVMEVYRVTQVFPADELYGLRSQIRRAAISIPSNIVEGCGRTSETEFFRFLDIAYASLRELDYQIGLANRLGYISSQNHDTCSSLLQETNKVLAALIRKKP